MKNKYQYAWVVIAVLFHTGHVSAQATETDTIPSVSLTIQQVWEKATMYSKAVRIKQITQSASDERIKDAKNERLPEISVDGEYARISNMPVYENGLFKTPEQFEVLHTTYTVGTEAYLNLYNGHKLNNEIDIRKTESKLAAEQQKLTLSEVKFRAAAYFLDMQRSIIFKDLLLKDIAAQEKQLIQIQALKSNGVVLKSDVLRAELKLSRQKLALVQLNNDLAIANQKLNILIGLPDHQRIIPESGILTDSTGIKSNESFLRDAENKSYQLNISAQETELRKLQLKNVRANISPKIGLFAKYDYSYPQIFLYPYSPYLYGIGLAGIKASFSLSSFYHNYHKTRTARLEYESQEIEHAQTEDNVRQQVNEAYLRYEEALNRVEVSKTNIKQATENRRIVSNTYFNQTSLITDLLDADTQLLQTRFDLAAAQIAAQLQFYQLQNITGNL